MQPYIITSPSQPYITEKLTETQTEVETLKAQIAQMQQLLTGMISGRTPLLFRKSSRI
ncbi:hypothetical protein [Okeania sp. KiyG1]|uniref:hypothetical protein n=1 Tax=Okeania sp. KiyG1 TaxID=2720165 RepID=UPI0019218453|nr:hypothetical protein [Okeania sp. KiyG1]